MPSTDLRVLVISHGHPSLSLGGAEVGSYNLHKGLNELDGVESFYLARVGHPVPRHGASALMSLRQKDNEILYHAENYDHFLLSNRSTDEIDRDLLRFVKDYNPDVVHFHHVLGLGMETIYAVREALPDAAIFFTFHEFLTMCHNHGQMVKSGGHKLCNRASPIECNGCFPNVSPAAFLRRERFIKSMLDLADHYVSPSQFLADRFIDWGLDADKMSVIENGLDIDKRAAIRPLTKAQPRRARFAYFGQLTMFKGADVLLDAVGRVPDSIWGDDARLMIFGGNLDRQPLDYQEKVKDLIEKAGERVRFYGAYQNSEMPRLMEMADWTIIPSIWWENSPIVIQEAFFHGRPMIASNIGGMAEKIEDGVNGLHFRVGSAEDLADRLIECLTDKTLWDRMHDGIRRAPTYIECAEQHLAQYRGVLENRPSVAAPGAAPQQSVVGA
ncbi:glycosyltransferase family 4 protein [Thalassospira marina]|uniref:Glycosyl transferase n=1 Tax=Thalassospira marina TaxID=2048283 RepID=A0A2N3KVA3_9PROT|nr:glycosyltransferase family 4 protein [Thalassospira marina]AUG52713.1 glycosyl transferase [Thalassospira marina]PKR54509.1 glycosyl transferase [Thalassospira marina]